MAEAQEEILYRAAVIDETLQFFERFDRNLEKMSRVSEEGFNRVDSSIKQSGTEIGVLAGIVSGATTALVGFAQQAIGQLKQFVDTSIDVAARVDTLGVSVRVVGRNFGYTEEQLAEFEEGIKSMGITTQGARQIILNMLQANLDLSKATTLARVAQDAAVISGSNSTDTFNRMLYAITRLDTQMLRNMGIIVDLQQEYAKVAAETGRSSEAISTTERQAIALNAVLEQGAELAGTYEAAMGTVGKQMGSMPRLVEEVQLALGAAFQPAKAIQIGFMSDKLKELHKWLTENQTQLQAFAERAGTVTAMLFEMFDKLLAFIISMPKRIEDVGLALATVMDAIFNEGDRRVEISGAKWMTTLAQLLTLWGAFLRAFVTTAAEVVGVVGDLAEVAWLGISGQDQTAAIEAAGERVANMFDVINNSFDEGFENASAFFGLVKDESAAVASEEPFEPLVEDAQTLFEALQQVSAAMKALKERMEEEVEMRAIKEARQQMEDALRLSFQIEDIERAQTRRLEQIRESFAEQQDRQQARAAESYLQLEEDRNSTALKLELDYQRRLRDMRQRFNDEAGELARQRDAVGLLRLARQYDRDTRNEETRQQDRRSDAESNYQERLRNLQESLAKESAALETNLQEQLTKANEARNEDYENLKISLQRQQAFRQLQQQFEEEDRQRAFEKEQEQLAQQFADIEGLTEEGLAGALGEWESYFGDLTTLIEEYSEIIAEMMEAQAELAGGSEIRGGRRRPSGGGRSRGGRGQGGEGGIIGQAGLVSQMLTNPVPMVWRIPSMPSVSQIPAVHAQRNVDRREIIVEVRTPDPYLQRQITNTLYEIERNRG